MSETCGLNKLFGLIAWGPVDEALSGCSPGVQTWIDSIIPYALYFTHAHGIVAIAGFIGVHLATKGTKEATATLFRQLVALNMTHILLISAYIINLQVAPLMVALLDFCMSIVYSQFAHDIELCAEMYSSDRMNDFDFDKHQKRTFNIGVLQVFGALAVLAVSRLFFYETVGRTILFMIVGALAFAWAIYGWFNLKRAKELLNGCHAKGFDVSDIMSKLERQQDTYRALLTYVTLRMILRLCWSITKHTSPVPTSPGVQYIMVVFYIALDMIMLPLVVGWFGGLFSFSKETKDTMQAIRKTRRVLLTLNVKEGKLENAVVKGLTRQQTRQHQLTKKRTAIAEKQFQVSVFEARWWKDPDITLTRFCSFPNPVNTSESRIHAVLVSILLVAHLWLDYKWNLPYVILPFVVYGFIARATCGPRLDPQAHLVLFVLRPLFVNHLHWLEDKFSAGPPKRFAQVAGAGFSLFALIARIWISPVFSWGLIATLIVLTTLQGLQTLCAACAMFYVMMQAGIIPQNICDACKIAFDVENAANSLSDIHSIVDGDEDEENQGQVKENGNEYKKTAHELADVDVHQSTTEGVVNQNSLYLHSVSP